MIEKDEKLKKLLADSLNVFMKFGIRSVTMDDMARHLGISKKTLYKHVKDKNDLVIQCMKQHQAEEQCAMEACVGGEFNAIEEMFEISQVIVDQLQNIHPSVMYDLEKYYPEALGAFNEYKMSVIKNWVEDNMKRGIEEGLYRNDLNIPILTAVYLARMNDFFDENTFPTKDYSFEEIYVEIFRYHIRGLASEEGIKFLKTHVSRLNKAN